MYSTMVMSTLMAISSTNLFMIWFSLELNLFSFLPLLLNKVTTNEIEASMNYFLTQTLGSTLFLLSSTMLLSLHSLSALSALLLTTTILLKLGAVPCHFWYPATMEMISWMNCLLLSTWQKFTPMFIMLYMLTSKSQSLLMMIISPMNALVGGTMSLNQTSLKKVMAYSSITHMGWMLSSSATNTPNLSTMYLILYSTMTLPLFTLFNKTHSNNINDLWLKQKLPSSSMIPMSILLLSMSGLPPLTGFMPKLLMMNTLLNHSIMLTLLLITGSTLSLFFYLNLSLNMLLSHQEKSNTKSKYKLSTTNTLLAMNFLLLPMLMM